MFSSPIPASSRALSKALRSETLLTAQPELMKNFFGTRYITRSKKDFEFKSFPGHFSAPHMSWWTAPARALFHRSYSSCFVSSSSTP